ncbi:MAG: hypothetical protein R3305_05795, partial [Gammaproteobacteria bacterium]|nr:hypothetical protein [Gammaproteobacteria bacterium]
MLRCIAFVFALLAACPGQAQGSNSCTECHAAERRGFTPAHAFGADNCTACHAGDAEALTEE